MTYFCKAKRLLINKMVTQHRGKNMYLLTNIVRGKRVRGLVGPDFEGWVVSAVSTKFEMMNIKLIQTRPAGVCLFGPWYLPQGHSVLLERGRWSVILVLGATIGGPPPPSNFCGLTRNVVDNKGPRFPIMRLTRNVDENKQVNQFLPGMLLKNKVLSHFSGSRQFWM